MDDFHDRHLPPMMPKGSPDLHALHRQDCESINQIRAQWVAESGACDYPAGLAPSNSTPRRTTSPRAPTPRRTSSPTRGYPSPAIPMPSPRIAMASPRHHDASPRPCRPVIDMAFNEPPMGGADTAEVYRELERMEVQLMRERTIANQALQDKKAAEESHRRDVDMLEKMLADALAENERLKVLVKGYESAGRGYESARMPASGNSLRIPGSNTSIRSGEPSWSTVPVSSKDPLKDTLHSLDLAGDEPDMEPLLISTNSYSTMRSGRSGRD
eukprot:gnl/TRDRNA2_/TRDRNA2_35140_c1_seq1.p1 gnl/TRDRNA2_/TRDRNA2_35140_c1~~gnl/TRDRNA2_/TRDRNA2_35140_c1_seq1.p1  ORF type:complete len:308 (+),score=40.35 gnl/TRDRNA2_/TRDRNA2_35140_c1_seq1:112-924(+)